MQLFLTQIPIRHSNSHIKYLYVRFDLPNLLFRPAITIVSSNRRIFQHSKKKGSASTCISNTGTLYNKVFAFFQRIPTQELMKSKNEKKTQTNKLTYRR